MLRLIIKQCRFIGISWFVKKINNFSYFYRFKKLIFVAIDIEIELFAYLNLKPYLLYISHILKKSYILFFNN